MPLELQIIRASEFIRLGAQGRLDLAASLDMLKLMAHACWQRGINQAKLDLREVRPGATPMLTPKDLAALVNAFCEMGFSKRLRLAVLYSSDPHRRARLFAFLSTLRGWKVIATENFEEAMSWLFAEQGSTGEKEAGGQEIPIQMKTPTQSRAAQTQPRTIPGQQTKTPPPSGRRSPAPAASKKAVTGRKSEARQS